MEEKQAVTHTESTYISNKCLFIIASITISGVFWLLFRITNHQSPLAESAE